jgi:hypothetical protein
LSLPGIEREAGMSETRIPDQERGARPGERKSEEGAARVRLCELSTPAEIVDDAARWCTKYGWFGMQCRHEVEEQLKLQYYYGGQAIYVVSSTEGTIIIPIPERFKDTPELRYVLLTAEERRDACLTVPPCWRTTDSEI